MKKLTKLRKAQIKFSDNIVGLASKLYNTIYRAHKEKKLYSYNEAVCAIELCKTWVQTDFIRTATIYGEAINKFKDPECSSTEICAKELKLSRSKSETLKSKEHDVMFH